jgi:hypothetical protein
LGEEVDKVGLVEVMIILDGIVEDDGKEDDGAADEAADEGIGQLGEPGFLVETLIRAGDGKKDEPANGDGGGAEPEPLGQEEVVIDKDGFRKEIATTEMEDVC